MTNAIVEQVSTTAFAETGPMRDGHRHLKQRAAFVSGGMGGIGTAVCRRLARNGVRVVAGCLPGYEKKDEWLEKMRAEGLHVHAAEGDVEDYESCAEMFYRVGSLIGPIDVLVNNAGITRDQLMLRMKRDDWDAVIATNLTAAFTATQAVLKPMIRQRGGRIVCISSVVGQSGNAGQANYAASKAGLIGFAKAVAQEVASRNVTVNVVAPGMIDTDMTRAITEKAAVDWSAQIPLGRLGAADDVAAAVCFLASDEASYITGHVLAVNGGMYM
jgi:3-oxoacyl-(acyl-carrier-protein) reductase